MTPEEAQAVQQLQEAYNQAVRERDEALEHLARARLHIQELRDKLHGGEWDHHDHDRDED
jgi:hypothetical protein